MAICSESSICVLDFEDILCREGAKDIIKRLSGKRRLIFHDGKRAMSALAKDGIAVIAGFDDTMLAAYPKPSAPEYLLQHVP